MSDMCENGDCENIATEIAYSRNLDKVVSCCENCSKLIVDEDFPEYWHKCENCGCMLGIN